MADRIEELESDEQFNFGRYVGILKRRHVLFLMIVLVTWLVVWGSSWLIAPKYKSGTLILVEQPSMPTSYVAPNVSDNLQDRLQTITQQILSRTRLLTIIDQLHLYQDAHQTLTPDEKVGKMRKDISIKVESNPQTGAITAFHVFYTAPSPHLAQNVTEKLTGLFISENLRVRQQQSEETTQFLQDQLATANSQLAAQDAKVSIFRTAHQGSLPSQEASNLQILSGLQSQLLSDQDALSTARQQRIYTQSLLNQYQEIQGTAVVPGEQPTGLAAIDQQLASLRVKLASLRTRYTERYPEVEAVNSEIARTEKIRKAWVADHSKQSPVGGSQSQNGTNPVRSASILQLESQLQANETDVANRERAIANLKTRINEYQGRLNQEPGVQQQLADLTRGSQQSQTNYDTLLKKVQESQMATSMEQMQEGQRFKVLDPPSLPLRPDFPNRLKMCGIGFVAAIVLGCVGVFGMELFDDRLHGDDEIKKLLSIPVVAEVPEVETMLDKRRNRRHAVLRWAITGMVAITIVAGAAFSYLHP